MESEELYLNPELRLSDLVGRLGVTRNQLSYVINKHLGKNFYDFVNEYRIRRVLRLMNEQTYDDKKIIAMAFDAGFNSKPAFNAVFKKYTGFDAVRVPGREKKVVSCVPLRRPARTDRLASLLFDTEVSARRVKWVRRLSWSFPMSGRCTSWGGRKSPPSGE